MATDIAKVLVADGCAETVLNVAANYGPTSRVAMNVLVETLDDAGTVHRFAGAMLLDRASVDDVAQRFTDLDRRIHRLVQRRQQVHQLGAHHSATTSRRLPAPSARIDTPR